MDDLLYDACFGSLTFGAQTTIAYYDFSDEAANETAKCDKAKGDKATHEKWIEGDALMEYFPYLSSITGSDPLPQNAPTPPQIVFLAVYGLPKSRVLTIRKEHFLDIIDSCHFPNVFLQTMCEKTGHFAHFVEFKDEDTPGWISVVLKTPHSAANFSFVLRTRLSDLSTVCLLIIEDDLMLDRVIERLHARRSMIQQSPIQVISILCEEYGYRNEAWREELDVSVVTMELRIVMTGFDIDSYDESINDYEPLIQNLHETSTNLTWLDCTTNFELRLLEFSRDMVDLCEALRTEQSLAKLSARYRAWSTQETKFLVNSCLSRQYHVRGLQERAKAQISILSSQISQRDSRINLSTARDSKGIARSTLQDGKAMKTIAVLGLIFLPATLIASIYGAGIFDFRADGVVVSSLWWTYAVASVGLTLLVLMLWATYIRQSSKSEKSQRQRRLEEVEKMA